MQASRNNFHAAGFGKVAPWVDLANSEEWNGFGKLTDHLAKAPWLATFLKHWNLHPLASKDVPHRKLVQLRVLLRRAAEKLAAGGSLNARELSSLNQALNVPGRQKLVQGQNGFRAEMVPLHFTDSARVGASDAMPLLLFDAAYLQAEIAGLDRHADTLRSDFFLDGLGDLACQALLHLQAAREHVDHAGALAEPQHPLVR